MGQPTRVRVIIATFETSEPAGEFTRTLLDVYGIGSPAIATGVAAAYLEAYDQHRIVAAWVPDHLEGDIRDTVERAGGLLHEPPRGLHDEAPDLEQRRGKDEGGEEPSPGSPDAL